MSFSGPFLRLCSKYSALRVPVREGSLKNHFLAKARYFVQLGNLIWNAALVSPLCYILSSQLTIVLLCINAQMALNTALLMGCEGGWLHSGYI
jgi:hypothetical protein